MDSPLEAQEIGNATNKLQKDCIYSHLLLTFENILINLRSDVKSQFKGYILMNKKQTLADLNEMRDRILAELKRAQMQVDAFDKTLKGLNASIACFEDSTTRQTSFEDIAEITNAEQIAPTEAVKQLFQDNPARSFTGSEIGEHLKYLDDQKRLRTKSNNIANNTGYIVKRLLKQGSIEKYSSRGRVRFRLSKK